MKKKLYRNKDEGKLLGICAGLADYFDLDVTLVRALWIIVTLLGGAVILIYIVLASISTCKRRTDTKLENIL